MSGRVKWHQRLHFESGSVTTGNPAWDSNVGKQLVRGNCTWDTAAKLIAALNGRDRTDVFMGYPGDECMDQQLVVSGGNAGRYLVLVQEPRRYFYLARQPEPTDAAGLVEVVIGGLPAFYPAALIIPLAAALAAAEHYFRTGRRARKLSWMRGDIAEQLRRGAEADYWRR
jgi:hypothetical protein